MGQQLSTKQLSMDGVNKHTCDHHEQTHALSHLEIIIKPLFIQTCQYLTINENIKLIPRLSKQTRRMFDVNACCCGKYVSVLLSDQTSDKANQREVQLMRHTSRLSVTYRRMTTHKPEWSDHLKAAIKSGHLKSLYITDPCFRHSKSALSWLLTDIASPTSRLQELHIEISGDYTYEHSNIQNFLRDCQALKQCAHLQYLHLKVDGERPFTSNETKPVLEALPPCLTEFIFHASVQKKDVLTVWRQMLESPDFLPFLKRFVVPMESCSHETIVEALSSTIMTQTGCIRPITYWRFSYELFTDMVSCLPLAHLDIYGFTDGLRQLVSENNPSILWPNLHNVQVMEQRGTTDWKTMLSLVNGRPITQLDLYIPDMNPTISPTTNQSTNQSVNFQSVHNPLIFRALRFLKLTIHDTNSWSDQAPIFAANGMPCLEILNLHLFWFTSENLSSILQAGSGCRHLSITNYKVSSTLVLAIALSCCHSLITLDILDSHSSEPEHVEDVKSILTRFPIRNESLQHLKSLVMYTDQCCDAAYHYLVKQLAAAPQLQIFRRPTDNSTSLMRLCIAPLLLPHMRNIPERPMQALFSVKTRSKLLAICAENVRCSYTSPLESRKYNVLLGQKRDADDMLLEERPQGHMFFDDFAYVPTNVPALRGEADESGLTGQQQFVNYVHQKLTRDERAQLSQWARGDYSVLHRWHKIRSTTDFQTTRQNHSFVYKERLSVR